jgi:hypothetical protein
LGGQPIQGSTLVTLPTASPAVSAGVAKRINSAVAAMSPTAFCGLTSPSPSTNEPRLLTCDSCTGREISRAACGDYALEIFDDAWRAAAINGQLACEHQIILAAARVAMVVNP